MEILITISILIVSSVAVFIAFYKWSFKYWERKNIPYDKPSIPMGSIMRSFNETDTFGILVAKQYKKARISGFKEYGAFLLWTPVYMPIDPQIIKNVLTADFPAFANRGIYYHKKEDPLSAHLAALDGPEWRELRGKLTPTFTSGKMKMMIHTIIQCAEQLSKYMGHLAALNKPVNVKEVLNEYTMDVIGSCAFGLDCNSFENPDSEFIKYGKLFFIDSFTKKIREMFIYSLPNLAKKLGMSVTNKDVSKFFLRIVKETVEYREKNKVVRNDFLQLLLNLKNETHQITLEEIAAQAFIFFVAGFDTSSSTISFALYEMSINPAIQEKAKDEIDRVLEKNEGVVSYEALADMKYLGQVIDETLRKYPPIPHVARQCSKNYKIPGTNDTIENGTTILISSWGLHYDPEYFLEPEKFDPGRFSKENKSKILPYTYLPFGEGPRICIGSRFAIMQVKVALMHLLKNYKFSLNEKTQIPLKFDPASISLLTIGGIWLNATKINC